MKIVVLTLFLGLTANAAEAVEWALQPGDDVLRDGALQSRLAAGPIGFFDGGQSRYGPDDDYSYIYKDGGRSAGEFRIGADGSVCVDFYNGRSRCDLYVRNAGRLYLITEKGDRFPVIE